ncbi:MAG: sulfate adenylyltransferase subunit CysN [Hyphomicrobiales bacterium]|nr:sulfate adenylyltransferase subunit CysN [Hyphomicrobiales bacterium]MDE2016128.1 sulfate adenylyltransferase subunit CysN [Hyphomicrobiales bacterium]
MDASDRASLPALTFITCGSVDDGKSTLIGRLLHERGLILDDQASALARDSKRHGTVGEEIDYALLVDGLEAEREQGITIDVAWRYFSTPRRAFVVADTPGHEQYTRNMATGASNADFAVLLVDARKGLLTQTRRHAYIVSLLGVRHVALAVNKIDLVDFDEATYRRIVADFAAFAAPLGFASVTPVPISARFGDNVAARSARLAWHDGPTLLEVLEAADASPAPDGVAFRLPVQWVNRPHLDFRGYCGTVAAGDVAVGDEVAVAASGKTSRVASILVADREAKRATAGDAVTLTLADEIDVARGDVLADPKDRPQVADQFAAHLIWMDERPLLPGRAYWLKCGARALPATVTDLKHRVDVNTLDRHAAKTLALNEIGVVNVSTAQPLAFDAYARNRATGAFVLIDRETDATAAAGLIDFPLRRATNVHRQALAVTREARAAAKRQKPAVLWFTGLSGAGKSTIANLVETKLSARGAHTILLDGDNVRHGLNRDLGFTDADRVENVRRVAEVSRLMTDAGLIVLCSFISPFRAERALARETAAPGEFVEIHVEAPLDVVIGRDPKGLYRKALKGEIKNFTGIDQPYEPPADPELALDTTAADAEALADRVIALLEERGHIERL